MGNLQSVRNALERIGCETQISSAPESLYEADALVLPGVGAFGEAMRSLHERNLVDPLKDVVLNLQKPLLGICLGMQLLADSSEEGGVYEGLSMIPGQVRQIPVSEGLRIPHIGWNNLSVQIREPLFKDLPEESAFYFVHSYQFQCHPEFISATTNYGVDITAAVQKGPIFGVQFHPERSQRKGLHLLRNFVDYATFASRGG